MIIYIEQVLWHCEACGDVGDSESQRGAERQANSHECVNECTCGAVELEGCCCGLSPREFFASRQRKQERRKG